MTAAKWRSYRQHQLPWFHGIQVSEAKDTNGETHTAKDKETEIERDTGDRLRLKIVSRQFNEKFHLQVEF